MHKNVFIFYNSSKFAVWCSISRIQVMYIPNTSATSSPVLFLTLTTLPLHSLPTRLSTSPSTLWESSQSSSSGSNQSQGGLLTSFEDSPSFSVTATSLFSSVTWFWMSVLSVALCFPLYLHLWLRLLVLQVPQPLLPLFHVSKASLFFLLQLQ